MILLRPKGTAGRDPANGADLIAQMAADLCRIGLPADEREAIRTLCQLDYRHGDVAALAEDALFEARQRTVAGAFGSSQTPPSLMPSKASQARSSASVLAAPGPKDGGFLFSSAALLALEAPLTWRAPEYGA